MSLKPKIWIFGHSVCLPYGLAEGTQGWADILSNKLGFDLINFARPATDNFFIYQCYLHYKNQIRKQDIVIISWSHYSRKSFVLNRSLESQTSVLDNSLHYVTGDHEFIRSVNTSVNNATKWLVMKPINRGIAYYDNWFENYYNPYEQKCNFQSYFDSVRLTCTGQYIPFFLSKESVEDIDISGIPNAGYMVEFILENNVMIGSDDIHLNEYGHKLWAEQIFKAIDSKT